MKIMPQKKKPIIVHLKKGKHKTQPFTFVIDDIGPGPKLSVRERYANKRNAKVGALRKLKSYTRRQWVDGKVYRIVGYYMQDGREIIFK